MGKVARPVQYTADTPHRLKPGTEGLNQQGQVITPPEQPLPPPIPYRRLRSLHETKYGLLADPLDIALMKLVAVSQRGSKRDFIDLACFLRHSPHTSLGELLELLPRKFGKINGALLAAFLS